MGISVEVWNEVESPTVEDRVDFFRLPPDVVSNAKFPLLQWVDPWGAVVFNGRQCEALISELDRLPEDDVKNVVRSFAVRCSLEGHTYLAFLGD
jgi:hypothetical protein